MRLMEWMQERTESLEDWVANLEDNLSITQRTAQWADVRRDLQEFAMGARPEGFERL
jgi:hypothetical protein